MARLLKSILHCTLVAGTAFTLSACSTWAEPPEHLTLNQDVKVKFQSSKQASNSCSDIYKEIRGKKKYGNIKACAYRKTAEAEPIVIIPNPCEFDDVYATLLCHELGHINQMAFGQVVDHAGWGAPAFKTASAKTVIKKSAQIDVAEKDEKPAKAEKVLKTELMIPKLRGPISLSPEQDPNIETLTLVPAS